MHESYTIAYVCAILFYCKTSNSKMTNKVISGLVILLAISLFMTSKWLRFYGYFSAGKVATVLNSSYDYIVVGAGSSGSVVAARLSENPNISVLLLEAGGEETGSPSFHIPGCMFEHLFSDIDWAYQIVKPDRAHFNRPEGQEETWGAGRVLGGGSIINYLQYARGSKYDYDTWEQAGCTGWGYKDVLPYFLKSEDIQVDSLKESKFHAMDGFLGVSDSSDHPLNKDFLAAGHEMGYDYTDHNGEKELGFSSHFWNSKHGVRSSPSRDLLRNAMERDNVHVSVNSFVTKVNIVDKQTVSVDFIKNGKKVTVRSNKEVILSAGALASPKILMLSGVGPETHLKDRHIPVLADLPVGQNLQYHYIVPLWVSTNSTYLTAPPPTFVDFLQYLTFDSGPLSSQINAGVAFLRADDKKNERADFEIQLLSGKLPTAMTGLQELKYIDEVPAFTFTLFHLHPKSTGFMKLRSRDPFDSALLDPMYFSDASDIKEMIKGIRLVQKLINTKSMTKHNVSLELSNTALCKHTAFDSDEYWDCYIRNVLLGGHHSSTCKMGDVTDPTTVVEPDLTVKGIKGLRVIDASILPSAVSGNTNAPCIMVGEKGAALVLEKLTKK